MRLLPRRVVFGQLGFLHRAQRVLEADDVRAAAVGARGAAVAHAAVPELVLVDALAFVEHVLSEVAARLLNQRPILRTSAGDERHRRHRGDVVRNRLLVDAAVGLGELAKESSVLPTVLQLFRLRPCRAASGSRSLPAR